ncbi:MAG TPA: transposase [Burkholderiales bacterium]|jgi:putative transposase|nr:transposase [Burkholderiales bacterium]
MPRPLRLILPGVAVHIIQRGNNRVACFRQDSDCLVYLSHLQELAEKHECAVHAYCLMTNHVHLLLTPAAAPVCAALMRDLGRRYVQYFNRRYERSGTLWEGRFRSCLAQSARYVIACYRYIESNPVRAGMVQDAMAYRWSSHAVNSGIRSHPPVTPHAEYLALSVGDKLRHAVYRGLFEHEQESSMVAMIRDATNGGYPLASDTFKASVLAPLGARTGRGKPGPKIALGAAEEKLRL